MTATPQITDTLRLDWVDHNRSFEHDSNSKEHWIVAWVPQGHTGNEHGVSGKFIAAAPTFAACIDKFIKGDIKPVG